MAEEGRQHGAAGVYRFLANGIIARIVKDMAMRMVITPGMKPGTFGHAMRCARGWKVEEKGVRCTPYEEKRRSDQLVFCSFGGEKLIDFHFCGLISDFSSPGRPDHSLGDHPENEHRQAEPEGG